jgi:PAS domain S-box-containing protein
MRRLLKRFLAQVSRTVPLQIVLIVPFVVQTLATVGLVGYFSFKDRQEAVNDLASQLRRELAHRIESKLQTYTEIPHNINRLNASTFAQGKIDADAAKGNFPLWQQIQIYPMVSDIYCGNRNGSLLGVRRNPADRSIELRSSNAVTGNKIYGYSLNRNGQPDQLVSKGNKPFDARLRPWFKASVATGKPVWSEIYADFVSQLPTITASAPVYSIADGTLLGVCATDLFLPSEMSRFLASLEIGKTGSAFILERSGQLVATSNQEAIMSKGADSNQLSAVESQNLTVRTTTASLRDHFRDLRQIQSVEQFDFSLDGNRQLVQVTPFKDAYGLDWLIVTVLPESDFMAQIHQSIRTTILLCSAALILGMVICILTARWITQPIVNVSRSAKALADGKWDHTVEIDRSGDLGELARSFNQMAEQIRTSFATKQSLNEELAESESKLKQFLEAVQVGIAVLDATGRPYYLNQRGAMLLGKGVMPDANPEELSEIYQVYVTGTDRIYLNENMPLIRALSGDRTYVDDMEIHQNDKIVPIEAWGTAIFDELGNVVFAIAAFQDITERKRAERMLADYNQALEQQVVERTAALQASEVELRDREQELRLITDALPICIFYTDADQRYRFVNKACEVWFSRSRDQIISKHGQEFLGKEAYQAIEPYVKQALGGQFVTYEAELSYAAGRKHISATYIPDFDLNGQVRGYYGLVIDIGDRKLAEEASILEERNRMAREIHDTLAQSFTSIIVHLDAASQRRTLDPEASQTLLKTARTLARSGLTDARRSVEALRPQILEEGDLHSALSRFTAQMFAYTSVQAVCEAIGEPFILPKEVEMNLLRIGQESLTNAFKYANATEIHVELRYEQAHCILQIEDNGKGFESTNLSAVRGFGLLGITERAERIGAELTIQSHLGKGTKIIVRVQVP